MVLMSLREIIFRSQKTEAGQLEQGQCDFSGEGEPWPKNRFLPESFDHSRTSTISACRSDTTHFYRASSPDLNSV